MASLTQWTWVWSSSGKWRWTGNPGVLHSMGSQRVVHDWVTELNWLVKIFMYLTESVWENITKLNEDSYRKYKLGIPLFSICTVPSFFRTNDFVQLELLEDANRTVLKIYTEHPVVKTAYSLTAKETMMKRQLCTLQLKQIQQREKEGKQLSKNDVNLEILI